MLPVRDDIEDIPGVWAWDNGGGYLLRELHFSCGISIILVLGEGICSIRGSITGGEALEPVACGVK